MSETQRTDERMQEAMRREDRLNAIDGAKSLPARQHSTGDLPATEPAGDLEAILCRYRAALDEASNNEERGRYAIPIANEVIATAQRQLTARDAELEKVRGERDEARARLLTAAGDDLCRLSQEEIKAMSAGAVKIPPKDEFLASCERFHAQVAGEAGVNTNCLTLAQLIAEAEQLRQRAEAAEAQLAQETKRCGEWIAENVRVNEQLATLREALYGLLKFIETTPSGFLSIVDDQPTRDAVADARAALSATPPAIEPAGERAVNWKAIKEVCDKLESTQRQLTAIREAARQSLSATPPAIEPLRERLEALAARWLEESKDYQSTIGILMANAYLICAAELTAALSLAAGKGVGNG